MLVCLYHRDWQIGGGPQADLAALLLEDAPRVATGPDVLWADVRGLPAVKVARAMIARLEPHLPFVRAGISEIPIAAEIAARAGTGAVQSVEPGHESAFLAPLPLDLLRPAPRLATLLQGLGIRTCADLAALSREAVEVRLGSEGSALWKLARADDPRILFRSVPRAAPHAALEFPDYHVTQAESLHFPLNHLLGSICSTLESRGTVARDMTLTLFLSDNRAQALETRASTATADRTTWLRLLTSKLGRTRIYAPVTGLSLQVGSTAAAQGVQGDLFDKSFATAKAVQSSLSRVLDAHGDVLQRASASHDPRPEAQNRWAETDLDTLLATPAEQVRPEAFLTLHLLHEPEVVVVQAEPRRDHLTPRRYRDHRGWHRIATAAGPDRISGATWDAPYAREYHRCVTERGQLVWLYRDLLSDTWHLHGWWE